ncbi:D-alanine--D-alanine ligase family protein [Anaerolineales bacterium HSG6]|nr:D-alanine--D-alanine ligase family protein [Anaerolineales bacterium HSG6]
MIKQDKKLRIGLLFGGQSGEHEVSLTSAQSVMQAIDLTKYEIIPIGISKTGQWLTGENVHQQLLEAAGEHPMLAGQGTGTRQSHHSLALSLPQTGPLDLIFPVLHGTYGEDGKIQGLLELLNLPYVGAEVTASAVCMDKVLSKEVFRAHGLPIVIFRAFLQKQWQTNPDTVLDECEAAMPYPMFVKPANLGSSVGIHKTKNRTELEAGLNDAVRYDRKVIVEQGLEAREIEVSVLGNDEPQASVPGEVIPSREFYSYAAKYLEESKMLIPAPLSEEQASMIQQLAIMAFQALDCVGLARCDFFVEKETGEIFVNELNTMPGFTPLSMYPKLWAASGLSYSDLLDRLIELALARHQEKQTLQTSFDVATAQ